MSHSLQSLISTTHRSYSQLTFSIIKINIHFFVAAIFFFKQTNERFPLETNEQLCQTPTQHQQGPIASQYEAQPDFCEHGTIATPQEVYTTTLLGVVVSEVLGPVSRLRVETLCLVVHICNCIFGFDFSLTGPPWARYPSGNRGDFRRFVCCSGKRSLRL